MHKETITIDVGRLRDDMKNECYGAYFGGGFGGALIEAFDADSVSDEKLIEMASRRGINLKEYQV